MKFTGRSLNILAGRDVPGVLGLLVVLGLTPGIVAAQTLEAINEHYLIEARYDKGQAYAGNNLSLKITLKTPANQVVPKNKILKLARYEAPEESNTR